MNIVRKSCLLASIRRSGLAGRKLNNMQRNPLISALSIPSFLLLILSEFFSQFAMNLFNFILLIVVFQISSSNLAVAGVVLAFTLPSILFGIIAGVFVDNWNKKRVLVITNIFLFLFQPICF